MWQTYIVRVNVPEDIRPQNMAFYIRSAIHQWRKGGDPESTYFQMPDKHFTVKHVKNKELYDKFGVVI